MVLRIDECERDDVDLLQGFFDSRHPFWTNQTTDQFHVRLSPGMLDDRSGVTPRTGCEQSRTSRSWRERPERRAHMRALHRPLDSSGTDFRRAIGLDAKVG